MESEIMIKLLWDILIRKAKTMIFQGIKDWNKAVKFKFNIIFLM